MKTKKKVNSVPLEGCSLGGRLVGLVERPALLWGSRTGLSRRLFSLQTKTCMIILVILLNIGFLALFAQFLTWRRPRFVTEVLLRSNEGKDGMLTTLFGICAPHIESRCGCCEPLCRPQVPCARLQDILYTYVSNCFVSLLSCVDTALLFNCKMYFKVLPKNLLHPDYRAIYGKDIALSTSSPHATTSFFLPQRKTRFCTSTKIQYNYWEIRF